MKKNKTKIEWNKIPEIIHNDGSDGYGLKVAYHMRGDKDKVLRVEFTFFPESDLEITNDLMHKMCQEAANVIHKYLG